MALPRNKSTALSRVPNLPEVDLPPPLGLGVEDDFDLGRFVADARLAATQKAFDLTYQAGIERFLQSRQLPTDDELWAARQAAALREGQRSALLKVGTRSLGYSALTIGAAWLINCPPQLWGIFPPIATMAAIVQLKHLD